MEARPCPISEFLNGDKQMLVPLFQRPYEWNEEKWSVLWEDLLEQYENSDDTSLASHFTGAIVTAPAKSVPVGVSKYLVIDGQQRLTTVVVIICAIRSLLPKETSQYKRLTRLLVNDDYEELDFYKLLPTQPDRDAFKALITNQEHDASRFSQAFTFYQKKLRGKDSDGVAIDLERMAEAVRTRLTVVAIHLGDSDDPYLIFESLNAKGAPLTQADLIRNYVLLRLHSFDQQRAYETAWLPMQKLLTADHLAEFMRHYLMQSGEEVAKSGIYAALKKRMANLADSAVFDELHRLQIASVVYAKIVGLKSHADPQIAERLDRLRRWEIAVANPFILKLLLAIDHGAFVVADAVGCLAVIEAFAVRRTICAVPTNQLKRIFLSAAKDMPSEGKLSTWLAQMLTEGASGRRWPKDEELKDWLFRYRAYSSSQIDRCKFILESLEDFYAHKEPASYAVATIEHVMPQQLSDEWRMDLGADAVAVHERCLDLLGNLTLSGYNSQLSNSRFSDKRRLLEKSHFELNAWIVSKPKWGEAEIRDRTLILFDMATQIWPRPSPV